jgi:hypothetical protein
MSFELSTEMNVFIQSPLGDDRTVVIRTETGEARVIWKGATPPELGETDVEISLQGPFRWGAEVIQVVAGERPGFGEDGSLVAAVEGVDFDGVLKLRMAGDVFMIAPTGSQPRIGVGDLVRVRGVEIEIYPTNI